MSVVGMIGYTGTQAPILEGWGYLQPGGPLPELPLGAIRQLQVGWGNIGTETFTGRITLTLTKPDGSTVVIVGRDFTVSPNRGAWVPFSIVFDQAGAWRAMAILSAL